ncbi:MAG: hypothetical protein D6775_16135 [Caldilineae bacterium]|nr:MAG: hypothetical protein D6775_16135 [Caldilineae bacterium]
MGPIEILFLVIFLFFLFVALVRGYERELGVTTLIFVALFIITFFGQKYVPLALRYLTQLLNRPPFDNRTTQHILSLTFSIFFILVLFSSYAGDTFSFKGKLKRGPNAVVLDLLIGALNGYLVAGSLWYFQDFYEYPFADTGLLILPLRPPAEAFANYLPPYVAPPMFWAGMVMVLMLLRVRK